MRTAPLVTVLLPVRNGEKHISDAVASILLQSFTDFELIVIDDGSDDSSVPIVERANDPRIRIVTGPAKGLPTALNTGIDAARGRYLARMDADDLAKRDRLARQVGFMEAHPGIGASGTWVRTIEDRPQVWRYAIEPASTKATLLFRTPLVHPSVIMRKDVLTENELRYENSLRSASEDWDLWLRVARFSSLANIGEVLMEYRVTRSLSPKVQSDKWQDARLVAGRALLAFGIEPTPDEIDLHLRIAHSIPVIERSWMQEAEAWLVRITETNVAVGWCPPVAMKSFTSLLWGTLCSAAATSGLSVLDIYRRSPLADGFRERGRRLLAIGLRSIGRKAR